MKYINLTGPINMFCVNDKNLYSTKVTHQGRKNMLDKKGHFVAKGVNFLAVMAEQDL